MTCRSGPWKTGAQFGKTDPVRRSARAVSRGLSVSSAGRVAVRVADDLDDVGVAPQLVLEVSLGLDQHFFRPRKRLLELAAFARLDL